MDGACTSALASKDRSEMKRMLRTTISRGVEQRLPA